MHACLGQHNASLGIYSSGFEEDAEMPRRSLLPRARRACIILRMEAQRLSVRGWAFSHPRYRVPWKEVCIVVAQFTHLWPSHLGHPVCWVLYRRNIQRCAVLIGPRVDSNLVAIDMHVCLYGGGTVCCRHGGARCTTGRDLGSGCRLQFRLVRDTGRAGPGQPVTALSAGSPPAARASVAMEAPCARCQTPGTPPGLGKHRTAPGSPSVIGRSLGTWRLD